MLFLAYFVLFNFAHVRAPLVQTASVLRLGRPEASESYRWLSAASACAGAPSSGWRRPCRNIQPDMTCLCVRDIQQRMNV